MILTSAQRAGLVSNLYHCTDRVNRKVNDINLSFQRSRVAVPNWAARWPNGYVPYVIDNSKSSNTVRLVFVREFTVTYCNCNLPTDFLL